jgi:lipoic acid synthetase
MICKGRSIIVRMHREDSSPDKQPASLTRPPWLKRRAVTAEAWQQMKSMLDKLTLATVCEEAECPNIGECFHQRTATFLILGRTCTRRCRFCAVQHGAPQPVDPREPEHVVGAVQQLGLRHVVITSVTRDDLPDGGAAHFAACISGVHMQTSATVEVLVPDFQGDPAALRTVLAARPDVFGHNLEVVPRLYPQIRPQANYRQSLRVLERAKQLCPTAHIKSGLMLGVGEQEQEVIDVLHDLQSAGCDFLTLGQYLRPSPQHYPVIEYVKPETFEAYAQLARGLGFRGVLSGPFVRSSYRAETLLENA